MKMNVAVAAVLLGIGGLGLKLGMSSGVFEGNSVIYSWSLGDMPYMDLSYVIFFDKIFILFSSSVFFISSAVLLFSIYYMSGEIFYFRFHLLVLGFVGSMVLMVSSPSMFSVMLGWDGLGVTSFLLVIYYQNWKSINAGLLTMFTNRIGDVLFIFGIVFYMAKSSMLLNSVLSEEVFWGLSALVIVGAFTKSAQIPFSAWLPAAMAAPTPVSSLVHSSTLVTAGVYVLIRFYPSIQANEKILILFVGLMTMVMAGLTANYAGDMKKIVAYSTLSQLGLMVSSLGLSKPMVAFWHLLVHAYFKAMLFLSVGVLIHMSKSFQDLKMLGLNSFSVNTLLASTLSSGLSLAGFPFISGFYTKDSILEVLNTESNSLFLLSMMWFGAILTIFYSMRLVAMIWKDWSSKLNSSTMEYSLSFPIMSVALLWPLVIFSGSGLNWMLFFSPEMFWVSLSFKKAVLVLVSLGLPVGVFLGKASLISKLCPWSFSSLWNLGVASSPYFSASGGILGKWINEKGDQGWSQELSFQIYVRWLNSAMQTKNQWGSTSLVSQFILLLMMLLGLLMI